jgi:hypothetical protein
VTNDFVSAEIHINADDEVSRLGVYRFLSLPRIGERIMIGEEPADVWLRVHDVTHVAVSQQEASWDGMVILNCEIDV